MSDAIWAVLIALLVASAGWSILFPPFPHMRRKPAQPAEKPYAARHAATAPRRDAPAPPAAASAGQATSAAPFPPGAAPLPQPPAPPTPPRGLGQPTQPPTHVTTNTGTLNIDPAAIRSHWVVWSAEHAAVNDGPGTRVQVRQFQPQVRETGAMAALIRPAYRRWTEHADDAAAVTL